MIVLILEKAHLSLRGELTRWLHEPRANVFVGRVSALVRDRLWEKVKRELGPGAGALLIHQSSDEPGFRLLSHGDTTRRIRELDGLQLIQKNHPNPEKALRKLAARLPKGERRNFDWSSPPGAQEPSKPSESTNTSETQQESETT